MDVEMFGNGDGRLVDIAGSDPRHGEWTHKAFIPDPLRRESPDLKPVTQRQIANARAALAALDSTAKQLPNPQLLRQPTLRREAQSTSALEGTYEPLNAVLAADEDEPETTNLREILNYVRIADEAFAAIADRRPVTTSLLCDLPSRMATEGSAVY